MKGYFVKTRLALALFIFLLAACGQSAADSRTSGVKGQSLIHPAYPVEQAGQDYPNQPYPAAFTVLRLDGQEVKFFETDAEGKFEINLPPGDYILHPAPPVDHPFPIAADIPFTVLPGEFTTVVVFFDSGIR